MPFGAEGVGVAASVGGGMVMEDGGMEVDGVGCAAGCCGGSVRVEIRCDLLYHVDGRDSVLEVVACRTGMLLCRAKRYGGWRWRLEVRS